MKGRFKPLVLCPGPSGGRCGERSLVEPGHLCRPCRQAENSDKQRRGSNGR